jgi:hypothetical protein
MPCGCCAGLAQLTPLLPPSYAFFSPNNQGINRTGNLLVPNANYCLFEDFFTPALNDMHDEQERLVSSVASVARLVSDAVRCSVPGAARAHRRAACAWFRVCRAQCGRHPR